MAAGPGACGPAVTVTLPLGPKHSAKAKLSVMASVPAGRERDTLTLRCLAALP